MKKLLFTLLFCVCVLTASAQIGYQMSLLNIATGEPRANESVSVTVKITDSAGNVVCEETKRETTNDFGVLSMTVGSQDTFTNADWSKLPFFIEAMVDNRLIGRSQILSVPVAEHAKHTGVLTKELLCSKTWKWSDYGESESLKFNLDGSCIWTHSDEGTRVVNQKYEVSGDFVIVYGNNYLKTYFYSSLNRSLLGEHHGYIFK